MFLTILGWIGIFAIGCWTGGRWSQTSARLNQMVQDALDDNLSPPSWLLDEDPFRGRAGSD